MMKIVLITVLLKFINVHIIIDLHRKAASACLLLSTATIITAPFSAIAE